MKHNTVAVAKLPVDYLGFIFYEGSPRNYSGEAITLPSHIQKVGVFVDAGLETILDTIRNHKLNVVQLHGEESVTFCTGLSEKLPEDVQIWKVFGIKDEFDFDRLGPFEAYVDKFLFDTKGKEKGGNGYVFDWKILEGYPSKKPFILSGGIGLDQIPELRDIMRTTLPVYAIDVNSRFEERPGLKNTETIKRFIDEL